ncbi:MAG: hypothetical protein ACK5P7_08745 [Bdellovibrio sp.]|jgi:hypothetical protein
MGGHLRKPPSLGQTSRQSSKFVSVFLLIALFSVSCSKIQELPAIDETGDETATEIPGGDRDPASGVQKILLSQAMNVRYEKNGVLELKAELPAGTQLEVPSSYQVRHLDFRNSSGALERSSTGFVTPITLISVPKDFEIIFSASRISELNKTGGGLFVGAAIVGNLEGTAGNFAALKASTDGAGFMANFNSNGKPKYSYTRSATKRFGERINKAIDPASLSKADRTKYQRLYEELKKAADRTVETKKSYLMMDQAGATQASINFEETGMISPIGAWTIAVNATAVRHGFANVPCAEFQSELLRQAYQRAGYRLTEDFNKTKGNEVIWSSTAAVVNFSMALYKAGWVPWDATKYRPITGAFMMHGAGYTPGHTFISAGEDGRYIVDNGAPQGRDLRKTAASTIDMMFEVGVFFLPPGVNPPSW